MKLSLWKITKRGLLVLLLGLTLFLINLIWFRPVFINHFYEKIFIEFAFDNPQMLTECEVIDSKVVVKVKDTGIGISEADQQVIFDEFNQVNNPERDKNKGLGLGLAIVKRTAKLLDHPIDVKSKLGQGATFSISLELANPEDCIADIPPAESHAMEQFNDTLIVVVDDDLTVLEGTQTLLELWGCQVIAACDESQAMTLLHHKNRKPDGIIADYRLRNNQTGVDVIQAIHQEYNDEIPSLIVTGDIEVDRLKAVDTLGFQMLAKPVNALKLRTFLRNVNKLKLSKV
jgi:two-component system, sensor histidine kinase